MKSVEVITAPVPTVPENQTDLPLLMNVANVYLKVILLVSRGVMVIGQMMVLKQL